METEKKKEEKTDEEIAVLVQGGKIDFFGILIERYEEKLKRYGTRFLGSYNGIEDAVQDIFIKTYLNIKGFDSSRKFSSWIYRIAHNTFINIIKKREKDYLLFFEPDIIFTFSKKDDILEKLIKKEEKEELEKKLKEIKSKYREIIILYYFDEKSYKEISDILKIPISTVGVRLKRGLSQIEKKYEK